MANLAETVKKQTDRILRQRALNATEGVVVSGVSSGPGAPAPTINNPLADLTAHKTSADHDGRYYTESEIDGKLNFLTLTDTPAAYTGEGGKIVAVKSDVSGLEFVAAPAAENGVPVGGTTNQLAAKNSNADYDVKWVDAPAAGNGLPAGGAAGQVLKKIDSTDYNAQWADPSATPTGDGTEDTCSASITESNGSFTVCISFIEALSSFWLASIKYYIGATAGSVTVNLRTAGGTLLASKNIASTSAAAWNAFTLDDPVYLDANSYYAVEVLFGTAQKIWRRQGYLYSGTLWKQRQSRMDDWFSGANWAESPGLGLVEYDDTP